MNAKISFPLKCWQKALINAALVSMITAASTIMAAGGIQDNDAVVAGGFSGIITLAMQVQTLFARDIEDDDEKKRWRPLLLI